MFEHIASTISVQFGWFTIRSLTSRAGSRIVPTKHWHHWPSPIELAIFFSRISVWHVFWPITCMYFESWLCARIWHVLLVPRHTFKCSLLRNPVQCNVMVWWCSGSVWDTNQCRPHLLLSLNCESHKLYGFCHFKIKCSAPWMINVLCVQVLQWCLSGFKHFYTTVYLLTHIKWIGF